MAPGKLLRDIYSLGESTVHDTAAQGDMSKSTALHQSYWYTHKYQWSKYIKGLPNWLSQ